MNLTNASLPGACGSAAGHRKGAIEIRITTEAVINPPMLEGLRTF